MENLFENHLKLILEKAFADEIGLRRRRIQFVLILIEDIKNPIPDNAHVLSKMSTFSVNNCLRRNKASIVELLHLPVIENQWRKINLFEWHNIEDTYEFWVKILKQRFRKQSDEHF